MKKAQDEPKKLEKSQNESNNDTEKKKSFKDIFNIEIYKINDINHNKNYMLYDHDKQFFYHEIDLGRVFDILRDKNPLELLKKLKRNDDTEFFLIQDGSTEDIKSHLVYKQKEYFMPFRAVIVNEVLVCDTMDFIPVDEKIIYRDNQVILNIYRPKNSKLVQEYPDYEGFPCLEVLLKNILQEGYEKFLDMLAWKIQYPEDTIPCHWIIQDNGGSGKSEILVDFVMSRLFNIEVIMQEDLESSFNGYIKNSEFLILEEIENYSNEKKIKVLTGAKYLTLNDKFAKTMKIRNYNNLIIFTNDIKGLKISFDDRRFNVVGSGLRLSPIKNDKWKDTLFKSKEENKKFFKKFHKYINQELYNLYHYLKNKEVDRVEIQIPITNQKKYDMQKLNSTSEHEFMDELYDIGLREAIINYSKLDITQALTKHTLMDNGKSYISCNLIYDMYINFCHESNLKIISRYHFHRRLQYTMYYDELLGDKCKKYKDDTQIRVYELKQLI